ncbi:MAG: thioredoxin domain-containing protein [Candidatus Micrarchaeia archaeon]
MKISDDAKLIALAIVIAGILIAASIYASAWQTPCQQNQTAPSKPSAQPRINFSNAWAMGEPSAPVVIVEYSDFQCPFCAEFWRAVLPAIQRDFLSTGKARFVYKHFPLENIHPLAVMAAEAAECAGEQGHFWEYHDLLFANQASLSEGSFIALAANLSLDMPRFTACLESRQKASIVAAHQSEGLANGVRGTPTFFINGRVVVGAQPYATFKRIIEEQLAT